MSTLHKVVEKFMHRFDVHMQELLRGASIAFALKVLAAGLAFGLNVVLARLLGAEGSGIFFLALTIVLVAAAVGRVGMENALVRFIAANTSTGQLGKVLGVYKMSMLFSIFMSAVITVFLYLLVPWLSKVVFTKPDLAIPLTIMVFAVIPMALLALHAHALQGLREIVASISVLSIGVPMLTCLIAMLFVPSYGVDAAAWGYIAATIITLLAGRWLWLKATVTCDTHTAEFDSSELLATSMPLFGVVVMNLVITWSPMFVLGIWESSKNIGIFSAANRTAMLTSFILVAVNSIAAPKFAALYQQGDFESLNSVVKSTTKIVVLISIPVLLLFILIPEDILSIFGKQFEEGSIVLMILASGQFVNVATGSVGYLLMMSGNEKIMRNNMVLCAGLCIALNTISIPIYGVMGAAVSTATVLSLQNIISVVLVWKRLHILTIPWINLSKD